MKKILALVLAFIICCTSVEVFANTEEFDNWFATLPQLSQQTVANINGNSAVNNGDYAIFYGYPGQPYRRISTAPGSLMVSSVQTWDETGGADRKAYSILKLDEVNDIYGENQGSYIYDIDFNLTLTGEGNLAPLSTVGSKKAHNVYLGFFGGSVDGSDTASYSVINFYRDKIIESWERDNNDKVDIAVFDGDGLADGKYNLKYEYITGASASEARVNMVLTKYEADGVTPVMSVFGRKLKHMLAESKENYSSETKASLGWLEVGVRTPYSGSSIEITKANFGKSTSEVVLNHKAVSLRVGETKQLTAQVVSSGLTNKTISWATSANNVATVDENGLVTAVGTGTATVSVKDENGNSLAECAVTVTMPSFDEWFGNLPVLSEQNISGITGNSTVNDPDYALFYEHSGQPYRRFSTAPYSFKVSSKQTWDETGGSDRRAYGILKLDEVNDIYGKNQGKYIYDVDFNLTLTGEGTLAPLSTAGNRKSHNVYLGFFGGAEEDGGASSYSVISFYRDKIIESWERDNNDKSDLASFGGEGLKDGKYNIRYEYITGASASEARVNIILTKYEADGVTLENAPLMSVSGKKLKHMVAESKETYSSETKASLGWLEVGVRTPYSGSSIEITKASFRKDTSEIYVSPVMMYDGEKTVQNRVYNIEKGKKYSKLYADVFLEKLNTTSQNKKVSAILALFDGEDEKLLQIQQKQCDFGKQNNYECNFELDSFTATENTKLKLYVWNADFSPEDVPKILVARTGVDNTKRDISLIKSRITSGIYNSSIDVASTVALLENGRFTDLVYEESNTCMKALSRASDMLKAYYSIGNTWYMNETLKDQIASIFNDWAANDYQCSNWWENEIGVPNVLSYNFVYPLSEIVSESVMDTLMNIARRGIPEINHNYVHKNESYSGTNLTDKLIIASRIAALIGDSDGLEVVAELLENELQVFAQPTSDYLDKYIKGSTAGMSDYEGIAPDYSFKQHGILYSGGYGKDFVGGISNLLEYFNDTQYMPSKRALNLYADFILDGYAPMFKGAGSDFSIMGRYISRETATASVKFNTKKAILALTKYPQIDRRTELMDLHDNRIAGEDKGTVFAKHYWSSDYTVFHRPEFFVGVKNFSNRNISTEAINGENKYGFYLSDGATAILKTGLEYDGIYSVWDWSRIPGTTTVYLEGSDAQIGGNDNVENHMYQNGEKSFVGGVSDGKYAVSAMDYKHRYGGTYYYTSAKKAVFMFDDGFVSLGAGVTGNSFFDHVYTTLNQCILNGTVSYSKNNSDVSTLADETQSTVNARWINHDEVSYIFPGEQSVTISNKTKTGSWNKINSTQSSTTVSKKVFESYIDHGTVRSAKSFDYTVLPSATVEETKAYVSNPDMITVTNTTSTQSVWSKKANTLGAVFYSGNQTVSVASSVTGLGEDLTVNTSSACAVLLTKTASGWQISVSDPTNGNVKEVTVTVNGTSHKVTLPTGNNSGKTVTVGI